MIELNMNKQSIPQAGLKLFILLHAAHMNPYILQTKKLLSLLSTATVRVTQDISLY